MLFRSFVVTNLPVGTYSVAVERQGFKKSSQAGNDLVADGRLTVNFRLEPGAVTESVEVVAASGETVNSTSGEVARVIDGVVRQIEVIHPGSGYSSVPRVRVAPPGSPPRLSVERIPGALRFRVALSPDSPAQAIEASADLRKWAPFAVLNDPGIPFMEFVPPGGSEWMLFRTAP